MSALRKRLEQLEALPRPSSQPREPLSLRALLEAREYVRRNPHRVTPEIAAAVEEEIARREGDEDPS